LEAPGPRGSLKIPPLSSGFGPRRSSAREVGLGQIRLEKASSLALRRVPLSERNKNWNNGPICEDAPRHKKTPRFAGLPRIAGAGVEPTTFGLCALRATRLLH